MLQQAQCKKGVLITMLTQSKLAPNLQKGRQDSQGGVPKGKDYHQKGLGGSHSRSSETVNNDIVAVVPNQNNKPQRSAPLKHVELW